MCALSNCVSLTSIIVLGRLADEGGTAAGQIFGSLIVLACLPLGEVDVHTNIYLQNKTAYSRLIIALSARSALKHVHQDNCSPFPRAAWRLQPGVSYRCNLKSGVAGWCRRRSCGGLNNLKLCIAEVNQAPPRLEQAASSTHGASALGDPQLPAASRRRKGSPPSLQN